MVDLTQTEADNLLRMDKIRINDTKHNYPSLGGSLNIPLKSVNGREEFMLDITRGYTELTKGSLQNRSRGIFILARLDYGGHPHRNPDDTKVPSPHIHLYREGDGDKWAYPIDPKEFPNITNAWETLKDFMRYCHIVRPPRIAKELFT